VTGYILLNGYATRDWIVFFKNGDARGINPQHAAWLRILLTSLNAAKSPADMSLPGYRLHPLKGERKGQWAVSVSGNWR